MLIKSSMNNPSVSSPEGRRPTGRNVVTASTPRRKDSESDDEDFNQVLVQQAEVPDDEDGVEGGGVFGGKKRIFLISFVLMLLANLYVIYGTGSSGLGHFDKENKDPNVPDSPGSTEVASESSSLTSPRDSFEVDVEAAGRKKTVKGECQPKLSQRSPRGECEVLLF